MNLAQNNNIIWYWDWDGTKNLKMSYNQMDLVILEKNRVQYFEWFGIYRTFGKEEWE